MWENICFIYCIVKQTNAIQFRSLYVLREIFLHIVNNPKQGKSEQCDKPSGVSLFCDAFLQFLLFFFGSLESYVTKNLN